jgi:exopolyphosphatase/guanosine-5'-triphosphate,3'-diphosphate pyrophosphatase
MPAFGAIDVGSNALRLVVGKAEGDRPPLVLENLRESVRLGQDVFASGVINEGTIERATEAFRKFRESLDQHDVRWTKAVATAALREAMNAEIFLDRVYQETGIEVEVIGAEEEARLIHLAVGTTINLQNRLAMLVDIGGGSTEITLSAEGSIISTESYKMGAVRLLSLLGEDGQGEAHMNQLVQEYVDATQKRIQREIGSRRFDLCVGTGGNLETLADLRRDLLGKERTGVVSAAELDTLVRKLRSLSFSERVSQLGLRPDRADVIVPAAIIIQKIIDVARLQELVVAGVGLKDGLLLDMVQELYGDTRHVRRDQVMSAALQVGRKYQFDEPHALSAAKFSVQLFDQTRELHNLGQEYRLLLEVAALLHDIGTFVNAADHHKHTQYLLLATPIVGLNQAQMLIVANIARYHRKSFPKPQHELYRALSAKDRVTVAKLAALLRLADALDNEHASKVNHVEVEYRKPRFTMRLFGEGDMLLEKWALVKKSQMFEEVFSVKFGIGG